MDNFEAERILHLHNKWRRGADIPMLEPKEIGLAIDQAIRMFRKIRGYNIKENFFMETKKEYLEARKYFVDKYNNGYMADDEQWVFDTMSRINTYETAIKEVENTIERLRELQKHQMQFVIEAYRKEKRMDKKMNLEIGDWVICYNNIKPRRILAIPDEGVNVLGLFEQVPIEEIKPIPITPEILEKNGFDQYYDADAGYIDEFSYSGIKIKIKEKICWLRSYLPYPLPEKYIIPCEYVHELQHALRLCNIDKEIEL